MSDAADFLNRVPNLNGAASTVDVGRAVADSVVVEYWTIEVLNGELSALRWRDAYGDALVEAAHTNLVADWQWTLHPWGVALQVEFTDEEHWLRFRALPVVRAALDAVPDRVSGLLIYTGRGGRLAWRLSASPSTPRTELRRSSGAHPGPAGRAGRRGPS